MSAIPSTAFIGVRISWDMVERNSDFARDAWRANFNDCSRRLDCSITVVSIAPSNSRNAAIPDSSWLSELRFKLSNNFMRNSENSEPESIGEGLSSNKAQDVHLHVNGNGAEHPRGLHRDRHAAEHYHCEQISRRQYS